MFMADAPEGELDDERHLYQMTDIIYLSPEERREPLTCSDRK
jgi:hypothetical protein